MLVGMGLGTILWALASREPQVLIDGLLAGASILAALGLVVGADMGNISSRADATMGQFLAARPMTAAQQARIQLRAAAKSMLLAWIIWIVAFALAYGLAHAAGSQRIQNDGCVVLSFMLGSWISMTCLLCAMLTGRSRPVMRSICGALAAFVAFMLVTRFALAPPSARPGGARRGRRRRHHVGRRHDRGVRRRPPPRAHRRVDSLGRGRPLGGARHHQRGAPVLDRRRPATGLHAARRCALARRGAASRRPAGARRKPTPLTQFPLPRREGLGEGRVS